MESRPGNIVEAESAEDLYEKYLPWQNNETFNGHACIEQDGNIYRIERNFIHSKEELHHFPPNAGEGDFPLFNDTSRELSDAEDALDHLLSSLHSAGNLSLDVSSAISLLKMQQEQQEDQLHLNSKSDYKNICQELSALEQELSASPPVPNTLFLEGKLNSLQKHIKALTDKRQVLLSTVDKVKNFLDNFHFTSEADIESFAEKIENDYKQYNKYQKKEASKLFLFFQLLLFTISFILVAFSVYCYFNQLLNYSGLLASLGLIFNCLGYLVHIRNKNIKNHFARLNHNLQDTFEKFLQDKTICEESYKTFQSRLTEIKDLYKKLEDSRQLADIQLNEITKAQAKAAKLLAKIKQSQEARWEIEKKQELQKTLQYQKELLEAEIESDTRVYEEIKGISLAINTIRKLSTEIHESMPLLLDDSFASYDDDQLNSTLQLLHEYYPGQIILFTCHNRERALLQAAHLEHHYVTLS